MNELEKKNPKRYLEYSNNYDSWRKRTREEYIKDSFKHNKNIYIYTLIVVLIIYFAIGSFIFSVGYHNLNDNTNKKLTNLNTISNDLGERICLDKNMTYYKIEFDTDKIYLNCNKEVIILRK